jgi:hypothetical protein
MTVNLALPRGPLPPVAQVLAEAALQRQSALLGPQGQGSTAPLPGEVAAPGSSSVPLPASLAAPAPVPLPESADQAHISLQARAPLGAGFEPRNAAQILGNARAAGPLPGAAIPLPKGGAAAAPLLGAPQAVSAAAWPAGGLDLPLQQMVAAVVQQLTAQAVPQRVVAAQAWPLALAHALESGEADATQPPLQTWLVRQGTVQTPDGPRGLAVTLRVPVPWLAAQAAHVATTGLVPQGALQVPYTGTAQGLQSAVLALVLQGSEPAAARTSALLVLDFQPPLAAAVYGRDMMLARLDPWLQLAQLQASGQVPSDEERARHNAQTRQGLCDTLGCPYLARAACVQPFCLAMLSPGPVVSLAAAGPALG